MSIVHIFNTMPPLINSQIQMKNEHKIFPVICDIFCIYRIHVKSHTNRYIHTFTHICLLFSQKSFMGLCISMQFYLSVKFAYCFSFVCSLKRAINKLIDVNLGMGLSLASNGKCCCCNFFFFICDQCIWVKRAI